MNINNLLEERQCLEKQLESIEFEIGELPHQDFYCTRNGPYFKWYENANGASHYIPKKRRHYAENLAKSKYLHLLKKDILQKIKAIDSFLKHYNPERGLAQELLEDAAYAELLAPYVKTISQELLEWNDSPYESNPLYKENLVFRTKADTYVRSKSEAIIASTLFSRKIPFHYEELLVLGDSLFYPDFTLKHPTTGKLYYWEHFGMMDNPEYARKAFAKLQHYASNGIILGVNLIATFETKECPLDMTQVERMVACYFEV